MAIDTTNKQELISFSDLNTLIRYCLTQEEWYDECVADPVAYGYTKEQAIAEREAYYKNKQGEQNGPPQET